MTPEEFREMQASAKIDVGEPLRKILKFAKEELVAMEKRIKSHERFEWWCAYLTEGEHATGWLGQSSTHGFFVRSYRLGPEENPRVAEVELVVVPELLVRHALRVNIPDPNRPGVFINTSAELGPQEITARMLQLGNNVCIGTLDEVLREPCGTCQAPALVVALDEYYDNDNGSGFVLGRLCHACHRIDEFATYSEPGPHDHQYRVTSGIYRRP